MIYRIKRFFTFEQFQNVYDILRNDFLKYFHIVTNIKSEWKNILKEENPTYLNQTDKKALLLLVLAVPFGKELFIRFTVSAFHELPSIYVFSYFPFGFEGGMWDLIVSVPDHCFSFYFTYFKPKKGSINKYLYNLQFKTDNIQNLKAEVKWEADFTEQEFKWPQHYQMSFS